MQSHINPSHIQHNLYILFEILNEGCNKPNAAARI